MKIYRTAAITAVWRNMAKADDYSIKYVGLPTRFFAYILGILDQNSVATIAERTRIIDSAIKKINPACIVEIGAGFSSRAKRFKNIKFYELDLPYFQKYKKNIIPFEIGKDKLDLKVKDVLFIVEGVTMYLQKKQILMLLNQIKNYNGHILIDFFGKEYSTKEKNMREKLYKILFKLIIERNYLFDYRIENIQKGISLLKGLGYKNIKYFTYKVPKTLDILFYAQF